MEALSPPLLTDSRALGLPSGVPVCLKDLSSVRVLHDPKDGSRGPSSGCNGSELERLQSSLCLSPLLHDREGAPEAKESFLSNDTNCSEVEHAALALVSLRANHGLPNTSPSKERSADEPSRGVSSPLDSAQEVPTSGLEALCK